MLSNSGMWLPQRACLLAESLLKGQGLPQLRQLLLLRDKGGVVQAHLRSLLHRPCRRPLSSSLRQHPLVQGVEEVGAVSNCGRQKYGGMDNDV